MASNLHGAKQIALVALVQHREGDVQILLGRKRRGFGQGNIVLPGGKIEPGETAKQAAIREFAEETGLRVAAEDLELAAQINFRFPAQPAADMQCAAFIARKATGQLELTEELEPLWADPQRCQSRKCGKIPRYGCLSWRPARISRWKLSWPMTTSPCNRSASSIGSSQRGEISLDLARKSTGRRAGNPVPGTALQGC